jgi:hypothetical protein
MARTYMTPRKSTGRRFPSRQLAPGHRLEDVEEEPEEFQLEVEVEEDPEEVQPEPEEEDPEEVEMEEEPDEPLEHPQLYDGTVLEADADGDIVIPPAPVAKEEAPPTHVDPVPDGEGGDPDDSSDDSVGEEGGDNAVGDPEEDEDENPRYHGAEYHKHSTEAENGQFCILLWEVLQYLGYTIRPLYVTKHFSEPGMRDYYTCRVYIRKPLNDTEGCRYRSSHHSTAQFSTNDAAVNDAARRALWSICNANRVQLFHSEYRHVPRRASGTEVTVVPAGGNDRIDVLARVTAALNTDLEGATTEMNKYHEELQAAQVKIARLEAQLAGQRLPQEVMPYQTTASPPRKRLRYGSDEATTRLG